MAPRDGLRRATPACAHAINRDPGRVGAPTPVTCWRRRSRLSSDAIDIGAWDDFQIRADPAGDSPPCYFGWVIVELTKEYTFEAAHRLPCVAEGHKCSRLHGHSYKVEVEVRGPVDPATGWLVDFAIIDDAWAELHARFDHRNLNDVPGLENSTCENIAVYVFRALAPRVAHLSAVAVWETRDSRCTYRGG
jgi:6-pyruvoyltetrahydropterin/6-carboxytetrahydropterin synthase